MVCLLYTSNVLELVQRILSCEEANNDVDEWMLDEYKVFTYEEIVKMVMQESGNCSEGTENEADGTTEYSVSHADATTAFDLALRYIEQHSTATPGDIMLLGRWRNIASICRYLSLHQII